MVQYTLAQSPEIQLTVRGKDSSKAREKAMDQLIELMDEGKLATNLANGFSPDQLIEVHPMEASDQIRGQEEAVVEAVQVLNQLAVAKAKMQESRDSALATWALVDQLFTDEPMGEADLAALKEGFKQLKAFAQCNLRFRAARAEAESARQTLEAALN